MTDESWSDPVELLLEEIERETLSASPDLRRITSLTAQVWLQRRQISEREWRQIEGAVDDQSRFGAARLRGVLLRLRSEPSTGDVADALIEAWKFPSRLSALFRSGQDDSVAADLWRRTVAAFKVTVASVHERLMAPAAVPVTSFIPPIVLPQPAAMPRSLTRMLRVLLAPNAPSRAAGSRPHPAQGRPRLAFSIA